MGGKHQKPFVTKILAEGMRMERVLDKEVLSKEARKLIDEMPSSPPERQIYVRNLAEKVLRKELDLEVFKLFVKATNSYYELNVSFPRARMLARRLDERDKV